MIAPEEKDILDRKYWLDKAQGKLVVPENKKKKKITKRKPKFELKNILKFAPNEIKQDEEIVLFALENAYMHLSDVDDSLKENKEFLLKYVDTVKYPSFLSIPKNFQKDDDIFLKIFAKDDSAFRYYSWESNKYSNKEGIRKLIEINPLIIKDLSNTYKDDLELAKLVIDKAPNLIECLNKRTTEKICVDKQYCKDLLKKNIQAFSYLSLKLRNDKDFVFPYVKKNPRFLENVSKRLRNNKEFMEQFTDTFMFLFCAGEDILKDEELMLKALNFSPTCIFKIDKSLQNKEFYEKAIKLHPKSYQNISSKHQLDDDLIHFLLTHETYYNDKYEKQSTVDLIPISKLAQCREEYDVLPKNECISFDNYVRKRFINLYLTNNLPLDNTQEKQKKFKI